ncbi:MAG: CBS domain-containing protein [Oligoflexia bacterium]|nr:CBS domain-containing protein [Oligoflexia bacterium]
MGKRNDESQQSGDLSNARALENAIQHACSTHMGVLDTGFLCRSISVLNPREPVCVMETDLVEQVVGRLRQQKMGCVVVVDAAGKISGIFSERDLLLKVMDDYDQRRKDAVKKYMTPNPVTQPPHATIAFVLNLMSLGGFRHLPIVDDDGKAFGMVSVKDVIDFIVQSFNEDILGLELEE